MICVLLLYPLALRTYAHHNGWKLELIPFVLSWLLLLAFFVLRSPEIGVDTKYYCHAFKEFQTIPIRKVFQSVVYATADHSWAVDFEPGYRLLNKLLSLVSRNEQVITVMNGILIFAFLFLFIRKRSSDCLMSLWLFVTLGIFQTDMNVTRNAIAIFMCYCALDEIQKGHFLRYAIVVLLASSIHQTAILFLPVYFIVRYVPVRGRRIAIILGIAVILGLNTSLFRQQLIEWLPARYGRYFMRETENVAAILVGLFNLIVLGFSYLVLRPEEREKLKVHDLFGEGMWMMVLNLTFFAMSLGFFAWARVAALFGPYQIVFIPNVINQCQSSERRRVLSLLVGMVCFVQYVMRMTINNIGGTMPYLFFWQ